MAVLVLGRWPSPVRPDVNVISVPHWKVGDGIVSVSSSLVRVPGPNLPRIEEIQALFKIPRCDVVRAADEVGVDVVWVRLVFNKGAVDEDLGDANVPQLPGEKLKIVDKLPSPGLIPLRWSRVRAKCKRGRT